MNKRAAVLVSRALATGELKRGEPTLVATAVQAEACGEIERSCYLLGLWVASRGKSEKLVA